MGKNTENEKSFHAADDVIENLLDWANKLKALGSILSSLMWHIQKKDGDENKLIEYGEDFCCAITDYAHLIHNAIDEKIESTRFLLDDASGAFEILKNTNNVHDIYVIDRHLKSLSVFINEKALPALGLKNEFEDLKKRIMKNQGDAANMQ